MSDLQNCEGLEWRGWATKGNRPQITTCCRMTKKAAHRWAALFGGWIVPTLTSAAHSYPRLYLRILKPSCTQRA